MYSNGFNATGYNGCKQYGGKGYYFGASLLVYPIVEKAPLHTEMVEVDLWLPPLPKTPAVGRGRARGDRKGGDVDVIQPVWFDVANGKTMKMMDYNTEQGLAYTFPYSMEEYPVFQRSDKLVALHQRETAVGAGNREQFTGVSWQAVYTVDYDYDSQAQATATSNGFVAKSLKDTLWDEDLEKGSATQNKAVAVYDIEIEAAATLWKVHVVPRQKADGGKGEVKKVCELTDNKPVKLRMLGLPPTAQILGDKKVSAEVNPYDLVTYVSITCDALESGNVVAFKIEDKLADNTSPSYEKYQGLRGAVAKMRSAKKLMDAANVPYGLSDRASVADVANFPRKVSYVLRKAKDVTPSSDAIKQVAALLANFWAQVGSAQFQVSKLSMSGLRKSKVSALIDGAVRLGQSVSVSVPSSEGADTKTKTKTEVQTEMLNTAAGAGTEFIFM